MVVYTEQGGPRGTNLPTGAEKVGLWRLSLQPADICQMAVQLTRWALGAQPGASRPPVRSGKQWSHLVGVPGRLRGRSGTFPAILRISLSPLGPRRLPFPPRCPCDWSYAGPR